MQARPRRGKKWRRLSRKYEIVGLVGFLIVLIVALVGVLMYLMTSMNARPRY